MAIGKVAIVQGFVLYCKLCNFHALTCTNKPLNVVIIWSQPTMTKDPFHHELSSYSSFTILILSDMSAAGGRNFGSSSKHDTANGFKSASPSIIMFMYCWHHSTSDKNVHFPVLEPNMILHCWLVMWRVTPPKETHLMVVHILAYHLMPLGGINTPFPGVLVIVLVFPVNITFATPRSVIFASRWAGCY